MVPPIMIMSITNRYNLKCKGCFASTLGNSGRATYNKMIWTAQIGTERSIMAEDSGFSLFLSRGANHS